MLNLNNIELYKDMYNIYNLITKINPNYRLYFDKIKKKFLIINIKNNYEICLSFENFSFNILKTLQETQIEHSSKLFEQLDLENEIKNEKYYNNTLDSLSLKTRELAKYSLRTNKILQSDIDKIIEVKNA